MHKPLIAAGRLDKMLEDPSSPAYRLLKELYPDSSDLASKADLWRQAVRTFCRQWGPKRKVLTSRATGRVNLMGMHTDHRGGYVNPIAIKEVFFVVEPRGDDLVELGNADADTFGPRRFRICEELGAQKIEDWDQWTQNQLQNRQARGTVGDWSNYVKAGVLYLQHLHRRADASFDPPLRGMNLAVKGNVPIASGLSSSSAMVVGTVQASLRVNGLQMDALEMVELCRLAEWYVGTRGGGGDHAAIKFGKKDHILHIGSFPFSVRAEPFPQGYSLVLADSLVEARKQEGVRDRFNERIAAYVFGLLMLRRDFPEYAQKMEHLRDVNPTGLGVSEAQIYRLIASLPQRCSRAEVLAALPQQRDQIERTFASHAAPADGYRIRQICTYGITECIRSQMAGELLQAGDVQGFGELINISHEGDRVSRLVDGRRVSQDNSISDDRLAELIAAAESDDPQAVEASRLWRQPGGYDVSCPQVDDLVDIARTVPGVVGAGLVGAGLGGSMIALVKESQAPAVIEALAKRFYQPREHRVAAEIVRPVAGAQVLEINGG